MKNLTIAFGVIFLLGCGTQAPVVNDEPLTQTETPVPTVDKIVLDEWFDYGCHYCEQSHDVIKNLKAKYGDRLEVVERHYPLSAQTFVFAEASECARKQGKFAEFHDEIFTNYYGKFQVENITKAANAVGIADMDTFNACVTSGAEKDQVTADVRAAEKLGVTGTPFFQINKQLSIPGAISEQSFESLFDKLLSAEEA